MLSLISARGAGLQLDPYDLKNESLELSLYVGEHYSGNIWRDFARWVIQENLKTPSQVLDLGCENGVLTCFLASLWPTAHIVGVHRSGPAIRAAKALAEKLELKNVSFEQRDGKDFLLEHQGRFSIITATMVMHEYLERLNSREPFKWNEVYECLEDVCLSEIDDHVIAVLKIVETSLADGGYLITLNRSPSSATSWWYTQCLEAAGMKVSLSRGSVIETSEASGAEKFPLIVARKVQEGDEKTTPEGLANSSNNLVQVWTQPIVAFFH